MGDRLRLPSETRNVIPLDRSSLPRTRRKERLPAKLCVGSASAPSSSQGQKGDCVFPPEWVPGVGGRNTAKLQHAKHYKLIACPPWARRATLLSGGAATGGPAIPNGAVCCRRG